MSTKPSFPQEVQQGLDLLQQFGKQLTTTGCYKCGQAVFNKFSINKHMDSWSNPKNPTFGAPITGVQCQSCQAATCVGCRQKPTPGRQRTTVGRYKLDWCCDQGRVVAIWMIAAYFDEKLYETMPKAQQNQNQAQPSGHIPKGTGTGYRQGYDKPAMFGGSGIQYASLMRGMINFSQTKIKDADPKVDGINKELMTLLTALLPRTNSTNSFHTSPPSVLMPILELSFVLDACSELLRNDSIEDAVKRRGVYNATLGLVDALAKHPKTSRLINDKRYSKKSSDGIVRLIADKGNSLHLDDPKSGKNSSVATAMSNIVTVCTTMLTLTKTNATAYQDDVGERSKEFCEYVANVSSNIPQALLTAQGYGGKTLQQQWDDLHKKSRVTFVQDSAITLGHSYSREIQQVGFTHPDRMRKLVQEVASMRTSLPPGIFLKVAESRPDAMKALIIGPQDTPYAGAALEFDLFCPASYPQQPPMVNCPSASRYTMGLNPNLYAIGKVCLTLLGTFPGEPSEMWQPSISTIYQVLVSIQSMILNDNPMANIPGMGSMDRQHPQVKDGNDQFCAKSIYVGLERWLTNDTASQASSALWKEVLELYFKSQASHIMTDLRRKAQGNSYLTNFSPEPLAGFTMRHAMDSRHLTRGSGINVIKNIEAAFKKRGYL